MVLGHAFGFSQCPTITDNNQNFCASDNPRIADLVGTDEGGGLNWYSTSTGGSPLSQNASLIDGVTYYAENDLGTCAVRPSVVVTISGEPPSNVAVAISRCSSDVNTIAQLNATGSNIEWYDAQTGGNLLQSTTVLIDGSTYWVQQTENGCTSIRLPTTVTIIEPDAPTGEANQFFCEDPNSPSNYTLADVTIAGNGIQWYDSPTSTTSLDESTPLQNGCYLLRHTNHLSL